MRRVAALTRSLVLRVLAQAEDHFERLSILVAHVSPQQPPRSWKEVK
jgi:hypothetical protein